MLDCILRLFLFLESVRMKKETKISLFALTLTGGVVLATTGILTAGMAVVSVLLTSLTIYMATNEETHEKEDEQPEQIEPELFSNHLGTLTEQAARKIQVKKLNLDQCDLFTKRLKILLDAKVDSNDASLKNVLTNAIQQYINCMLDTHKQKPDYLSQYELHRLTHMFHIVLVYIGFETISSEHDNTMVANPRRLQNIDDIDKLLLAVTYAIYNKDNTNQNPLDHTSSFALEYLKKLAIPVSDTGLNTYIQGTITRSWAITSVNTPESTGTQRANKPW